MKTRKNLFYVVTSLCLITLTIVNIQLAIAKDVSFNSSMFSRDNGEGGNGENGSGETGSECSTETDCRNKGYVWGAYLKCSDGKVETYSCEVSGELKIWSWTIFNASYKKGSSYRVGWERWACEPLTGNCCNPNAQGVRVTSSEKI